MEGLVENGRAEVRGFLEDYLLPKDLASERLSSGGVPKRPYLDPILHRPREYEKLVRTLAQCGMLEFSLDVKEQCCLFSVLKKNKTQRLIIDARMSNC